MLFRSSPTRRFQPPSHVTFPGYADATTPAVRSRRLTSPPPTIITSPRSWIDRWDDSKAEAAGLPSLAPRERQVALALADGLTRAKVADRLGLSVHTVSTLARRLYRKLGVSSQAELTARLSGHDRLVPGEEE